MDKKIIAVIAVVVIVVIAAVAIVIANDDDDDEDKKPSSIIPKDISDARLQVYGNADNNDIIDKDDITFLNQLIASGEEWQTKYPFADANNDGVLDSKDVQVIQNFIDGKSERMYYYNSLGNTTYINYPLGHKIGTESQVIMLLMVTHTYQYWTACDQPYQSSLSAELYPGIKEKTTIGVDSNKFTVESIRNSGVDTLIGWTGGVASNYLWELAESSGLANSVSIVLLPVQGPRTINGAIMFACMMGDQSLSDDYVAWYEKAQTEVIDKLNSGVVQKKTCLVLGGFNNNRDQIWAYGDNLSPGRWFNSVVNFLPEYTNNPSQNRIGFEGVTDLTKKYNLDCLLVQTNRGNTTADDYQDWAADRIKNLFEGSTQYENKKIYTVDFFVNVSFAGPAGCYLYAAYLYPDNFSLDDAYNFLQDFLDKFMPEGGTYDAHKGFTYAMS